MDSVVLVPVALLAEPVITPVERSRKAHPKKLVLTGALIEAGLTGADSRGSGGAGCAAIPAWSLGGDGSSRLVMCPCAPRAASLPRAAGTSRTLRTATAARQATRATRRRMGGAAPTGTGGLWLVPGENAPPTLPGETSGGPP